MGRNSSSEYEVLKKATFSIQWEERVYNEVPEMALWGKACSLQRTFHSVDTICTLRFTSRKLFSQKMLCIIDRANGISATQSLPRMSSWHPMHLCATETLII